MPKTEIPDTAKPCIYFDVSSLFRAKDYLNEKIKDEIEAMVEISSFIKDGRIFLVASLGIYDTLNSIEKLSNDIKKEKVKFALEILKEKQHVAISPRYENPNVDGAHWFEIRNPEYTKEIYKDLDELKKSLSEEDYKIIKVVISSSVIECFITSDKHFFKPEIKRILHKYNKKIYKPNDFLKYFNKVWKPCQKLYRKEKLG